MATEVKIDPTLVARRYADEGAGSSELARLVDLGHIRELTDALYEATGISSAIVDLDGTVLTGSGWQPICTEFHRTHPETRELCRASDTILAQQTKSLGGHAIYRCPQGLIDCATPLIIEGKHVANVFTGQMLFAPPDYERFRRQAAEYGFDEEAYLEALARVPVLDEEQARARLDFLTRLAELIASLALSVIRQDAAIARERQAESDLRESEARYRSLFEHSPVAMWEEDLSPVKARIDELVASGVEDVAAYVLEHPDEYRRCLEIGRILSVNRAAIEMYDAASHEELIERADEVDLQSGARNLRFLWAAMAAGRSQSVHEDTVQTLKGRRMEVRETCMVAPGHETTYDRVYIADVDVTEHRRMERDLRRTAERLRSSADAMVSMLARTIELRDPYTAGHQERVCRLALAIARRLKLGKARVAVLKVAADIHDLGKIGIPAEILSRPGRLTDDEMVIVRQHPTLAHELLRDIRFDGPVAEIIYAHHERLDGSGYPRGITGERMRLESRILAVADVVEAMSAHRPYRPALGVDAALEEIVAFSGVKYDDDVVAACVKVFREDGFKFQ